MTYKGKVMDLEQAWDLELERRFLDMEPDAQGPGWCMESAP
jgi:hypothetical protein